MTLAEAVALAKPRIKRLFGRWAVAGCGRYADSDTMRGAWAAWIKA